MMCTNPAAALPKVWLADDGIKAASGIGLDLTDSPPACRPVFGANLRDRYACYQDQIIGYFVIDGDWV